MPADSRFRMVVAAVLLGPCSVVAGSRWDAQCTVGGVLVKQCVAALADEATYTDDYLRRVRRGEAAAALEAERARQERVICAQRGMRPGGVSVGMTAEDVLKCGWGKPQRASRRADARGVTELWIYAGRRMLTIDNGVVAVIDD